MSFSHTVTGNGKGEYTLQIFWNGELRDSHTFEPIGAGDQYRQLKNGSYRGKPMPRWRALMWVAAAGLDFEETLLNRVVDYILSTEDLDPATIDKLRWTMKELASAPY